MRARERETAKLIAKDDLPFAPNGALLGLNGKPVIARGGEHVTRDSFDLRANGTPFNQKGEAIFTEDEQPLAKILLLLILANRARMRGVVPPVAKADMALGPDGALLGPRRTPVLSADGTTIKPQDFTLAADGTPLGRDGDPMMTRDGSPLLAVLVQTALAHRAQRRGTAQVLTMEELPFTPDGILLGPIGVPVLGPKGKALRRDDFTLAADGVPQGRDNKPVYTQDGQPLIAVLFLALRAKEACVARGVCKDDLRFAPDGALLGTDGSPVMGADRKPIRRDDFVIASNGVPMNRDGRPMVMKDGKPLDDLLIMLVLMARGRQREVAKVIVKDDLTFAPDGTLLGLDGMPVFEAQGSPVKRDDFVLTLDGSPLGPDGNPLFTKVAA
eukprot:NODE_2497_length_2202_cov_2.926265.p2 GENE.NODE_2497_length_2202_cov_2.926265~~NODE_2497_length_2202_cov_2.926265.p2  ORF type:complete len:386 (+),score=150.66 NODE_2497_length_2202_cov_2.926265:593-1750(+)